MSKYNQTDVKLNDKSLAVPREFFDISVKASFDENVQANISTDEFSFLLDAYDEIKTWIENGNKSGVGIFEGIPIRISAQGRQQAIEVFNGIVDLQDNLQILPNRGEIKGKLRQDSSLNQLSDLIEPLDFGYLRELGVITPQDFSEVEYVVIPLDIEVQALTAFLTAYLLSKQIRDSIKELGETIATITSIASSGATGTLGATLYSVAVALIQAAYAAALLVLLVQLGIDMYELFIQPKRRHKCISLQKMLSKTCEYLGYKFNTTITDLESIHYLPSNINTDDRGDSVFIQTPGVIKEGIPNVTDFGYSCTELFQLCRDLFNARFALDSDTVQFHSENSEYWIRESDYIKPDALSDQINKQFRYNTDEIKASINLSFQTDLTDEYTIENFTGTNYQVLTDAKTVNRLPNKTIKNADVVSFPTALASRKKKLTGFERLLKDLGSIFDELAGVFGGSSNLKGKVESRIGVMKVSFNNHAVPKLIWLNGKKIPSNHRDLLSARALWEKYHNEKSFVDNNFGRQRIYIEGERIPFGFDDFAKVTKNSYFRDTDGKLGKITELEWSMNRDYAVISYWQQETYTKNLKQTFIEP